MRAAVKILLVDDSQDTVDTLSLLLSDNSHKTFTATSRDEALSLARSVSPDVVILDLGLPEKHVGLELCRLLRKTCNAVIVVVSGWTGSADREAALVAGADYFPAKPATILEIETAIERGRRQSPLRIESDPAMEESSSAAG